MNILQQFFKSLYSPKTIAMTRFQGIGKTILFVFFLSLLATLPAIFQIGTGLSTGLKGLDQTLKSEVPDFKIENGKLIADSIKEPLEIRKDGFIVLLDPNGTYTLKEVENKQNAIAFLKDEFVFASYGQSQIYEYSLLSDLTITKENIIDYLAQINGILPIIIVVISFFMYIASSAFKFIEIFMLAFIGLVIKNLLQKKGNFKQIWTIAAYSVTLATFFFTIMESIGANVPSALFVNWFVHFMMVYLAINEIPSTKKPLAA
ncbi:DUF1189 domain-containing protein [Metabacillus arenae]|uniref:DUF1189 domain-containing protein n=1 Tax=Metabacillus arenae TaxID=2771434 RepID=A0A926RZB9_9BACI|nr:DUF1189 domain-containing protein [Metabacillus arenae]MBD1378904.1 DUF1189 domain-containing protein [Metabacillus arenae]